VNAPEAVHFGDNDLRFELTGEPVFIRSNSIHGFKQMPVRLLPATA
jgi:hypothetical protein